MDLDAYTGHMYDKIVAKIREVRKEKGFTQKKIAQDLGLNPVTYSDMESGKTKFTVIRLIAVLKYLDIEDIFSTENQGPENEEEVTELTLLKDKDFISFLEKFYEQTKAIDTIRNKSEQQTRAITDLQKDNAEIKDMLRELLNKIDKEKPS